MTAGPACVPPSRRSRDSGDTRPQPSRFPIRKRRAASRVETPSSIAAITRPRRSPLRLLVIITSWQITSSSESDKARPRESSNRLCVHRRCSSAKLTSIDSNPLFNSQKAGVGLLIRRFYQRVPRKFSQEFFLQRRIEPARSERPAYRPKWRLADQTQFHGRNSAVSRL